MPSFKIFFAVMVLTLGSSVMAARKKTGIPKKSIEWISLARSLTGESGWIRQRALNRLRAMKELDEILTYEIRRSVFQNGKLNTQRFLALDVITALDRKNLMPVLLSESLTDSTGYTYHTINTLLSSHNADQIIRRYHDHLMSYPTSSAVKLALLDTLGRMGFELSLSELRHLNQNASNDVRSGLLSYLREVMILKNRLQYQQLFSEFIMTGSFEVRMQALYLFEELLAQKKLKFKETGLHCESQRNKTIQKFCKKLASSYS